MTQIAQTDRPIKLATPLGEDTLLVRSFRGREALSSPFRFELELIAVLPSISFKELLGKPVALSLVLADGSYRSFHGRISRLVLGSRDARGLTAFRAEMVPWLWFLTLTTDCRIFQNQSTQEIITQIFQDHGFTDFEFRALSSGQEKREYCVQYQESAFNFISRLLEEDGIWYFFEHSADRHLLVLVDSPSQHAPCPGQAKVRYETGSANASREEDVVLEAVWSQEVLPGAVALSDFNFEMPSTSLGVELAGDGEFEVYDYPGRYLSRGRGDQVARMRLEGLNAGVQRLEGSSTCRAFSPGFRFELSDFPRTDVEPMQLLLVVNHEARQSLDMGTGTEGGFQYLNSFVTGLHSLPYRPPLKTPRPVVQGTQTAVVVGKAGEEIWTDRYGRVKVQFHWDRRGKMDENSSCWVRVSHHWAGKQWGAFFLPRIGQEVIVDFLEGDPDRPIIIGRVYNAERMPPYGLPDDQTKSTIKSESSKGGGGFNELRFEDKAGEEEIFLHGQKDWTIQILNDKNQTVGHDETHSVGHDESHTVGNDRTKSIGHDETISVGNNRTSTIGVNETLTIGVTRVTTIGVDDSLNVGAVRTIVVGAEHTESIGADMSITVGSSLTESVGTDYSESVGGNLDLSVTGDSSESVGKGKTVSIGKDLSESIGGNHSESTEGDYSLTVTKGISASAEKDIALTTSKKFMLEATDEISLVVGDASLVMKKDGKITLKGGKITIEGSGDLVIKGSKVSQN